MAVSATNWHLPSTSTRTKSHAAAAADFQLPLKGVQGGEQKWGPPCSGKNWQNRSSDSHIFSGDHFMSPILASPRIWKSTQFLHGDVCSSGLAVTFTRLAETFCKKICAWLHILPLHQNHIYTDLPHYVFGAVSQSYLRCCLPSYSSHFLPNKT